MPDPKVPCPDCGKLKSAKSRRCRSCANRASAKDPDWLRKVREANCAKIPGQPKPKKDLCPDCGNPKCIGSHRCRVCANRVLAKDPEYCRKHTEVMRALVKTPEWQHAHIEGVRAGEAAHPERREERSKIMLAKFKDPEYRRKHTEAMRALAKNPEWVRNVTKATLKKWKDPEYRHKVTAGIRDFCADPVYRKKKSEERAEAWANGVYDQAVFRSGNPGKTTEVPIIRALNCLNIEHHSQYPPPNCQRIFDELVSPNILIEIQGDYWHSSEQTQVRDAEKAHWAKENGYYLVVIWEREIKERAKAFLVRPEVALTCGAIELVKERVVPLLGDFMQSGIGEFVAV